MRKLQIPLFLFLAAMVLFACKKETDQILSPDQLAIGSYIYVDKANSTEFNFAQINTSAISWDAHIVGEAADRVISYVSSSNNSANKTTWKKIKETTVGADGKLTISVTGSELATALGIAPTALSPGAQYVIYNEVVAKSGKLYNYNNTNAELEAAPAYRMGLRLSGTITCPFDPTGFAGNFEVVYDNDWQDFSTGDVIEVTGATANSITMLQYPSPAYGTDRQPVTVKINPANGRATIDQQYIGMYGAVRGELRTSTGRTSYVFSCTGDIILYQDVIYGGTVYGQMLLRLKKK